MKKGKKYCVQKKMKNKKRRRKAGEEKNSTLSLMNSRVENDIRRSNNTLMTISPSIHR